MKSREYEVLREFRAEKEARFRQAQQAFASRNTVMGLVKSYSIKTDLKDTKMKSR